MAICWRRTLGPRFSEGARLSWLALAKKGWSKSQFARESGLHTSYVSRYLYGDRKPGREAAVRIHAVIGVPVATWDQAPKKPFEVPMARAA